MPVALLAALFGSLAIHAAALVGMDVELFGGGPEPPPLRAELRPLPQPPPAALAAPKPEVPAMTKPAKPRRLATATPAARVVPVEPEADEPEANDAGAAPTNGRPSPPTTPPGNRRAVAAPSW